MLPLDPHGAIAWLALNDALAAALADMPGVFLATAHPAKFGEVVLDAIGDVILEQARRHLDGVGDTLGAGAAVALHHHAVEAQKDRAIVVVGVEMMAQQLGRRARHEESDFRA